MTEQVKSFEDLLNHFTRSANIGTNFASLDSDSQAKVKQLINTEYDNISYSRIWPWRSMQRWLKTTPVLETGTVSVTNGDRNITYSVAVTVTADFKGRFIRIGSDLEYYEIVGVDTGTRVCALSAAYGGTTDAAASHRTYRLKYGLWPDFADIAHIVPVSDGNPVWDRELDIMSPQDFIPQILSQPDIGFSAPVAASIFGKEAYFGPDMGLQFVMRYDFMNDPSIQDEEALWLWPPATSTLVVYYGKKVEPLIELTDQPLIPKDKRVILSYGALEMWYATQVNNLQMASFFQGKKQTELAKMIGDFDKSDSKARLSPHTRRKYGIGSSSVVRRYYPWLIR